MGSERRPQQVPAAERARLGRDFWFYFSGQAVSQLGGSFTTFALPLLVFKLTHSATNLALTTAAEFVPYLLFGLLLGAVVDRFDRKRLMLASDIAQALVIAVIPVLAIAGSLRVADIYAVTFVQSTLGIIFNCGEFAAIPSLVGERELVTANARIMATNNAGQVLGPGLAGALVAFVPVPDLLFVDAGSFLVSSACLALIRGSFNAAAPPGRPAGSAIRALLADVREGLAYVWSHPVLRSISIMMALINFVAATADSQLVLFARRALLATNSEIGFLYAAGAAGIVAVSLVAGPIRERLSFAVTALGALVLTGLTMTAMALAGSYPAALVLWAASSGFGMLFNINTVALRQAIVPPRLYGRVVSVAQVLAWSAMPLGSLAGAAAINLSGSVTGVYAVIGGLIAAIALAFAFSPVAHGDRYLAEAAERPGLQAGGELGHDVRRRLGLPRERDTLSGPHRERFDVAGGPGHRRRWLVADDGLAGGEVCDHLARSWPLRERGAARGFPPGGRGVAQRAVRRIGPADLVQVRIQLRIGLRRGDQPAPVVLVDRHLGSQQEPGAQPGRLRAQGEHRRDAAAVPDPARRDHRHRRDRVYHRRHQRQRPDRPPHVPAGLPALRDDHVHPGRHRPPGLLGGPDRVQDDSPGVVHRLDVSAGVPPHERDDPQPGRQGLVQAAVVI
jgi:MFS family permease